MKLEECKVGQRVYICKAKFLEVHPGYKDLEFKFVLGTILETNSRYNPSRPIKIEFDTSIQLSLSWPCTRIWLCEPEYLVLNEEC